MSKKGILIVVILLFAVIVSVVVFDIKKTQTDKRPDNPYALEYDDLKHVDPELITYKETRNIRLSGDSVGALTIDSTSIYVTVDREVLVLDFEGTFKNAFSLEANGKSLALFERDKLVVGHSNYVSLYDLNGKLIAKSIPANSKSIITNVAAFGSKIMGADAGNRTIYEYNSRLEVENAFQGKREEGALHGFIIPSANFDLSFTPEGELWVANPGRHALEQYDNNGRLRAFWETVSFKVDGFSGCCNPARIAIMDDGTFVTSEKGIVRIKLYEPSGKFLSVVAPPSKFKDDGQAPDIAVDKNRVVYALDYDTKMIRIFEPMDN